MTLRRSGIDHERQSTSMVAGSPAPPQLGVAPSKYHYSASFITVFVAGCSAAASRATCRCVIQRAQRIYSLDQFIVIAPAVNDPSDPHYATAQKLVRACIRG
jgi:hypothetical protein